MCAKSPTGISTDSKPHFLKRGKSRVLWLVKGYPNRKVLIPKRIALIILLAKGHSQVPVGPPRRAFRKPRAIHWTSSEETPVRKSFSYHGPVSWRRHVPGQIGTSNRRYARVHPSRSSL